MSMLLYLMLPLTGAGLLRSCVCGVCRSPLFCIYIKLGTNIKLQQLIKVNRNDLTRCILPLFGEMSDSLSAAISESGTAH